MADVSTALSIALGRLGHAVTLVMPLYREIGNMGASGDRAHVPLGGRWFDVGFVERPLGQDARVVFVECDALYGREGIYGPAGRDHGDNATRFGMLARAAVEVAVRSASPPSVIHAHDWQAGLVPVYARTTFSRHPSLRHVALVFTIHNIAYQGLFPSETVPALDLNPDVFTVDGLEFWGQASFLKAGINFSDLVTTVSEGYARQIVTPEFGYGFEGIVAARGHALRGILNGIDAERWNPETDRFLPAHFSEGALEGKAASKRTLLERYGLDASEDRMRRPVVGMISRLVYQKGFDLLATVIDELPSLGATFVVLGTGEPQYEDMWRTAAARYPDTVGVKVGYDEALAHLVEGGADVFLMPSRYEPCGLNQMYSMRYGTVPVVWATGGLDDVVEQYDERTGHGTGFKFSAYTSSAMLDALRLALRVYGDCERWQSIQQEGMRRDYSWNASASAYVREYAALVRQKHGEAGGETHA